MKNLKIFVCVVGLAAAVCSCASQMSSLSPTGDKAEITLTNGKTHTGELIAVTDSLLYLFFQPDPSKSASKRFKGLYGVETSNVQRIMIHGYSNKRWVAGVLLFEVVPTVLIAIAASAAGADPAGVLFLLSLPVAVNVAIFSASTPSAPEFEGKLVTSLEIRKYARFPQGLNSNQLESLLQANRQTEVYPLE